LAYDRRGNLKVGTLSNWNWKVIRKKTKKEGKKRIKEVRYKEWKRNTVYTGLLNHRVMDPGFSPCGKGGALW
jgi:hypothetical protein